MTDATTPSFIEILSNTCDALKNGVGKDVPDGRDADSREKLDARLAELEEQVASPLRGLLEDLSEMLGTFEHASTELDGALTEANTASDEFDAANNAYEEYDETDEEQDEDDLQNEVTVTEDAMAEADEAVTIARDELIEAIDTLVAHIGEVVKSTLSPDISTGPGEIVDMGGLSPDITSISVYQETGETVALRVNDELVTIPNAVQTIVGLSQVRKS
jgi:ABC-type transporter Mla subunit MlaD